MSAGLKSSILHSPRTYYKTLPMLSVLLEQLQNLVALKAE
jgi:hypothetical protein